MFSKAKEATQFISKHMDGFQPELAMILGSGLGDFAGHVENPKTISYEDIPHFHKTSVVGHAGKLVYGELKGKKVLIFQGRFHAYEGHDWEIVCLPTRVSALIGAKSLLVTNAAGGINQNFSPADLVLIKDHINLTGGNPLIGHNEVGPRFPDMSEAYNHKLNLVLEESAKAIDVDLKAGVYAGFLGPTYETPAEVQMAKIMGADMVGMSTVPEVIAANHVGINVCGVSCITNLAAGINSEKLDHSEVKEVANQAMQKFSKLVLEFVSRVRHE